MLIKKYCRFINNYLSVVKNIKLHFQMFESSEIVLKFGEHFEYLLLFFFEV